MQSPNVNGRIIPMDPMAEAMVLSAMMLNPEAAGNVVQMVGNRAAAFCNEQNQALYMILLELFNENKPFDPVLIQAKATQRNREDMTAKFLHEIICTAPSHAMAEYHAALLLESCRKRQMISALDRSLEECYSDAGGAKELLDRVEAKIFEVAQESASVGFEKSMAELLDDMMLAPQAARGIATGYYELDDMLIGLHPAEMSILAARPSVGKTAMALNIAEYISGHLKQPVGFFSMEMRTTPILERLVSSRAGVNMQRIRKNMLNSEEKVAIAEAFCGLKESELYIDDAPSMTVLELRSKARRLKRRTGVKVIIIDYLQLMDASERAENRQQEITRISRGIKTLANELDVHIMCLSQLNRSSETEGRRPRSSDLRESGSIEQDADVVMLLHRESVLQRGNPDWAQANPDLANVAELIVAKQRNGPCGLIKLTVDEKTTRFLNYSNQ